MKRAPRMKGCCVGKRPWTEPELRTLSVAYVIGGLRSAMAELPHRDRATIMAKASLMGLTKPARRWTDEETSRLRSMWGFETAVSIYRALGRSPQAVYLKARAMGLRVEPPEGFESVNRCADRMGYCHKSFVAILKWAKVPTTRHTYRPRRPRSGTRKRFTLQRRFVDTMLAEDAVAAWTRTETLEGAARRLQMTPSRLRRMMLVVGGKAPRRSSDGPRAQMREAPEVFDGIVAKYAEWRKARVRLKAAAGKLRVSAVTLRGWLRKHGLWNKRFPAEPVLREDVKRVARIELRAVRFQRRRAARRAERREAA
jgi:hypothetical protein